MRVVVTSPNWTLNGVNAFNATLARGLRQRGHDVTLLLTGSMWRDDKPLPLPGDLAIEQLALPAVATWPARWNALHRYLERAAPCVYLPNHDVAHSGISPTLSSRIGILGIAHSDDPQHYEHAGRLMPWWNAVVGVSETIVQALHRLPHASGVRVEHIAYGVEVTPAAPMRLTATIHEGEGLRILYAGRLEERQKRVSDLVAIAQALRGRGVAFSCTIAGDGPARAALEARIADAGVGERVRLVGTVPLERMAALYRAHDVFLLPSAFEGLPLVLLEAMAEGCVPVASDVASGVPELVRDGENGFRVAIGDIETFAERLAFLSRDVATRMAMSQRARDRVASGPYGAHEMVGRYEALLEDIWVGVTTAQYARRPGGVLLPPGFDWRAHLRAPLAAIRQRLGGEA